MKNEEIRKLREWIGALSSLGSLYLFRSYLTSLWSDRTNVERESRTDAKEGLASDIARQSSSHVTSLASGTESRHESRYLTVLLVSFTSYSLLTLVMSAHPTAYASLPLHYRFIMIDPSLLAKNLPRDQDVTRIDHVQNSTFHSFIGGPPGFTHHLTGVSHPS